MSNKETYGQELILDIHNCDVSRFNRKNIKRYLQELCDMMYMQRADLHWWDYKGLQHEYEEAPDHLKGTSCVQFIQTSSIVIHSLDVLKKMFINIFSCKNFDSDMVAKFTECYFDGEIVNRNEIERL